MTTPIAAAHLQAARNQGFALGGFNAVNLETAQAIVQAAQEEEVVAILQISENAVRYAGFEPLTELCRVLRAQASVPILLHYDHAETLASATRAVEAGFDAVMLEGVGADLDWQDFERFVAKAHQHGVAVEAELEAVEKGERSSQRSEDIEALIQRATEAGCDSLVVDIGSKHKQVSKSAKLDLERLALIAERTPLPLVLHGASGVPNDELQRAISLGISKVNIATDLAVAFTEAVRSELAARDTHDPRRYLGRAREAMKERVRFYLRLLSGKLQPAERSG